MNGTSGLTIRKATPQDIPTINRIFDDARSYQRSSGFIQWKDGYPNTETIERDIDADAAYVAEIYDEPAGYFFIAYDDPGYDGLEGIWDNNGRFAVVHRLAISCKHRGKGFAGHIISHAEKIAAREGAESMRVDTGEPNFIMQKIMSALGYSPKGLLDFPWGPRLTYEKRLSRD